MDTRLNSVLEKEFKGELHPTLCASIIAACSNLNFANRGEIVAFIRSSFLGSASISGDRPKYWEVRGWPKEEAIVKAAARNKRSPQASPFSKEFWKDKIPDTEIDAKIKSMRPSNIEHWVQKGLSQNEAREKVQQFQSSASIIGADKKKKNPHLYRGTLPSHTEYWVKRGYSEAQAKRKVVEHQTTFSLKKCIDRYGEEDGRQRWKQRQDKWLTTLETNGTRGTDTSILANEFFKLLLAEFPNAKCAITGGEKRVRCNGRTYSLDFFCDGKIIEVNGDFWHANPKKYGATSVLSFPGEKKLAEDIWKKDEQRLKDIASLGYSVCIIWEDDIVNDVSAAFTTAISFLKE